MLYQCFMAFIHLVDKHSVLRKKREYCQTTSAVSGKVADDFFFVDSFSKPHKIHGSQEEYESQMLSWMKFPLYLYCEKLKATAAAAFMLNFSENWKGLLWKRLCSLFIVKSLLQEQRPNLSRSLICLYKYDMRHCVYPQFPFKMNFGAIYVLKYEDRYRRILFTSFG